MDTITNYQRKSNPINRIKEKIFDMLYEIEQEELENEEKIYSPIERINNLNFDCTQYTIHDKNSGLSVAYIDPQGTPIEIKTLEDEIEQTRKREELSNEYFYSDISMIFGGRKSVGTYLNVLKSPYVPYHVTYFNENDCPTTEGQILYFDRTPTGEGVYNPIFYMDSLKKTDEIKGCRIVSTDIEQNVGVLQVLNSLLYGSNENHTQLEEYLYNLPTTDVPGNTLSDNTRFFTDYTNNRMYFKQMNTGVTNTI